MDLETPFTKLMGCAVPLQVAGMGSIVTPPLAAAVAREGGVGTFGVQGMPAPALAAMLDALPRDVPGAYAVTFLMPFFDADCVPVAAERVRAVEFYYAAPDAGLVAQAHERGALAAWQVGSVADAELAESAGCCCRRFAR